MQEQKKLNDIKKNLGIQQFIQRIKFVKVTDLISIFSMLGGFVVSLFFRTYKKNIWLVCERENEARDNGYWFYKYLCENYPEIEAVYAINKKSVDYKKVKGLGEVIQFGSFIHWIYYFSAKKNISSQKEGKPNAAICFVLEVYLGCRKNRAYIRHGICKDDQRWVYYDVTKMNLFTCSAKREYEFVQSKFGYPEDNVRLLGMCRYDNLMSSHEIKRQIVVMPTMREWLREISSDTKKYECSDNFIASEYYIKWNSLLNNKRLHFLLNEYGVNLIFYPHTGMQKYLEFFKTECENIIVADSLEYDVQHLLMESSVLITDYSSVYFDFAYMAKPLVYYQFDYDKYRKGQYQEGYFSYNRDGFGPVLYDESSVIQEIEEILKSDLVMEEKYLLRTKDFFAFHDNKNCERTYNAILDM